MREIKITIKTTYGAFEEDNLYLELARILSKLTDSIKEHLLYSLP